MAGWNLASSSTKAICGPPVGQSFSNGFLAAFDPCSENTHIDITSGMQDRFRLRSHRRMGIGTLLPSDQDSCFFRGVLDLHIQITPNRDSESTNNTALVQCCHGLPPGNILSPRDVLSSQEKSDGEAKQKAWDHRRRLHGTYEQALLATGERIEQMIEVFPVNIQLIQGIFIPFLGTSLGAATVFFLREGISDATRRILIGFAAGVMMAASFWSLLQPALDSSDHMGRLSFIPAAVGFLIGIGFFCSWVFLRRIMHMDEKAGEPISGLRRKSKLILAVTLHNIPEGMAVGVVYAGWLSGETGISQAAALVLSLGIAIQNFPEGAIVSMPLRAEGMPKMKTFWYGVLSGAVEPIAAAATIVTASTVVIVLPYMLAFAAGAMIYVVVEELIPEMSSNTHSNAGTVAFSLGFVLMMILDVALG
ncbi:ZIP family metal transporter [Propionibacterium australiense]|nr:ZIP family metal transporter [Propionibacterium australiense]